MPGPLLHVGATVLCAHGGSAMPTAPNPRVLVGGQFTACDGTGRNFLTRLYGDTSDPLLLQLRMHLGGCFDGGTGLMQDQLRADGLLPMVEPYTALGYVHIGGGSEQTSPGAFTTTGQDALVDWVVVELRDAGSPEFVVATQSALVQRDGDVIAANGTGTLAFNLLDGSYHVAVRHRNHLGIMTALPLLLSSSPSSIDFTDTAVLAYGMNARKNISGTMVLWPGDGVPEGVVKYAGASNDRDAILQVIGGSVPTATISGQYLLEDINLDGVVKYVGAENDRDVVLQTIGGSVPTATRIEQLP